MSGAIPGDLDSSGSVMVWISVIEIDFKEQLVRVVVSSYRYER
jgi:hypothetical protein